MHWQIAVQCMQEQKQQKLGWQQKPMSFSADHWWLLFHPVLENPHSSLGRKSLFSLYISAKVHLVLWCSGLLIISAGQFNCRFVILKPFRYDWTITVILNCEFLCMKTNIYLFYLLCVLQFLCGSAMISSIDNSYDQYIYVPNAIKLVQPGTS